MAIWDINPRADTHLLVLPERHVPSFREVGEFPADEAKRMLDFVAQTASEAGLDDYRVVVNVGEGGGQNDSLRTPAAFSMERRSLTPAR